jgi:prophage DNA circulation protein
VFGTLRPAHMSLSTDEFDGIARVEVHMVSGETVRVLGDVEARWFNTTRDSYTEQLHFTETTDLRDLDRLLVLELMVFRWTQQLAAGQDYIGLEIDDDQIRKNIKEYSAAVTQIKDSMGLTKKARDDAANSGDFATWLAELKLRARHFGVHREHQLTKALVLMNELLSIVSAYDRSDTEERQKLGFENNTAIVDWIRSTMQPEYAEIDAHFRENEQKYWVRAI